MKEITTITMLYSASLASAQGQEFAPYDQYVPHNTIELTVSSGIGQFGNPVAFSEPLPLYLLPSVRYYGERFYIDNLDVGYALAERPDWQLDLIARPSLEALYYLDQDGAAFLANIFYGLRPNLLSAKAVEDIERDFSYLGGVRYDYYQGASRFGLSLLTDLTGVHHGQEWRAEASHRFSATSGDLQLTFGLRLLSENYTAYYYGLRKGDLGSPIPPVYIGADAALNPYLRLDYHYPLRANLALVAHGYIEHIDDELSRGHLIASSAIINWFAGISWRVF
nr:MipA/OmpV family protein [Ferrimonas balearica]